MRPRAVLSVLLFAATAAAGAPRSAAAQDAQALAAAEVLFEDAKKLMATGQYEGACRKFLESLRLDPAIGTTLYLADCHEKNGQTASAWARFREAADLAKVAAQADRQRKALERAAALEPKLSRLTIEVPRAADVPGLVVQRDGVAVGKALWGTAVPVDAGSHVIRAEAPRKKPWSKTIEVATAPGQRVLVSIPSLSDAPVAPNEPSAAAATSLEAGRTQRILAFVIGGAGLVSVAAGSAFGLRALSKNQEALQKDNCPTATRCYPSGLELTEDAEAAGTASTVFFVVGGIALAGGVTLYLTAPSSDAGASKQAAARPAVSVALAPGSVGLRGSF